MPSKKTLCSSRSFLNDLGNDTATSLVLMQTRGDGWLTQFDVLAELARLLEKVVELLEQF